MEQNKREQFIIRRIGGTTYKVRVAFSETAAENVRFLVNFDIKIFHTPFFMLILCLHCMKRVKCCA